MNKKFLSVILFSALMLGSTGTFVSCKDYDDDIDNLQEQIDKKASIEEMKSQLTTMQSDLQTAKQSAEAAKTSAQEALKAAQEAKDEAAKAKAEAALIAAEAKAEAIAAAEAKVKAMQVELEKAINGKLEEVNALVTKVNDLVKEISAIVGKRLTSLVFAPTEYINGIESIVFKTFKYNPWKVLLADKADMANVLTIGQGVTNVTYYANPSIVNVKDFDNLEVLTENATNTTRAAGALVSAKLSKLENGKAIISLKKLTTESFASKGTAATTESFKTMALRANLTLTDSEVAEGLKPMVVSDWARLDEVPTVPYIHHTTYENCVGVADADVTGAASEKVPHFYPYTKIHPATQAALNLTAGKFITKEISYKESANLRDWVQVCDRKGNFYNAEDAGFAFEFNLVEYKLRDGSVGEEVTDQAKFANLTKEGKLTSRSINNIADNKDAVGREPMIQVVMVNTAATAADRVVDVRYFKIKWVENSTASELPAPTPFEDTFACGKAYEKTLGTPAMNTMIYEFLNISKESFHMLYDLDTKVYADATNAKAGTNALTYATVKDFAADGGQTTHNIVLDYTIGKVTMEEYNAGVAERTVWVRYTQKATNPAKCVYFFKLTLKLKINKMEFIAGYNQTYWNVKDAAQLNNKNAAKVMYVNPALTSDATYGDSKFKDCQIIGNILKSYNKTAGITAPIDLVKNSADAEFVFDESRVKAELGNDWNVIDNGTTLRKGIVAAAKITDGSIISLYENPVPTLIAWGIPSDPARELLGKKVPVKLISSECDWTVVQDQFFVEFITPLGIELDVKDMKFKDILTGGSEIDVTKVPTVKEIFGDKRTFINKGQVVAAYSNLVDWYHYEYTTWDLTKAKTNLKKDGQNIIITNDNLASNFADFKALYQISSNPTDNAAQKLIFHNNSGIALDQAFTITVPVYVKTKWAAELGKQYVTITVQPNK